MRCRRHQSRVCGLDLREKTLDFCPESKVFDLSLTGSISSDFSPDPINWPQFKGVCSPASSLVRYSSRLAVFVRLVKNDEFGVGALWQ